ncbi:hypothetical protein OU787_27120 [Kitasatospora sp. YST-16]|uniref:hypothetical protein n=1 Tax=Kitasatospora sp. YST-16 TaxID=2998080 RepID=UPI0022846795|nr:hypothetical protein [Kitasatospora sp. YST-16]WAL74854.1 hypothetical protein OU787_27120 [Kitasatospora sp. YST-16]WNW40910.1 hypothetical protein RKE32_27055 [Streptomyces sp. Li-HN-5-13]
MGVDGAGAGRRRVVVLPVGAVDGGAEWGRSPYRSMSEADRSALWRQRLHEAEAGLTRYLVSLDDQPQLAEWFALQGEIFADLPEESAPSAQWQRLFFRGQALMERFLVRRYGEQVLEAWAASNAEVHRTVEPDHGRGAADPIHRIARQAELYGSEYEFDDERPPGRERAELTITHCAIWDYREQARRSGVTITLTSPCTYCTHALSANIRAKGFRPAYRLQSGPTGHGCHWEASAATEGTEEGTGTR